VFQRRPTLLQVLAPWTIVLLLAGGFQFFRGAPDDGIVFTLMACLLLADALGLLSSIPRVRQPSRILVYTIAAVAGVLLIATPRHGIVSGIVVIALGLAVLPVAWSGPPARPLPVAKAKQSEEVRPRPLWRAAILWSALGVAICLWEVTAFFFGMPSEAAALEHPTISILLDPVLNVPLGHIVFVVCWLLGGIALLRLGKRS